MANNEKTSKSLGKLASKALRTPEKVTKAEIRKLGGTALTQIADKKKK